MTDVAVADLVTRLTTLIAAHGVYALTPILIFYIWGQVRKSLDAAAPEDHEYFKKCHTWTLVATAVFFVLSSAVWIYATFMMTRTAVIRGSMMGLSGQSVAPSRASDPAYLLEQIVPETRDFDMYERKGSISRATGKEVYDLDWVILPRDKTLTAVTFVFQHDYKIWSPPPVDPLPIEQIGRHGAEARPIFKRFKLDLSTLASLPDASVQIVYEQDSKDEVRNVGHLYIRKKDGRRVPVRWEPEASEDPSAALSPSARGGLLSRLIPTLWALGGGAQGSMFDAGGAYDARAGRALRGRLASTDLKTQLDAFDVVVNARGFAFKFIADSIAVTGETEYDRQRLMTALARAVDAVERKGVHVSRGVTIDLAAALAMGQDFDGAARFFDRVADAPLSATQLYTRAYAYSGAKQYEKALRDFATYLKEAPTTRSKAVAETNIGVTHRHLKNDRAAIEHYNLAMKIDPAYPRSYNNLAYLYAVQGQHLDDALALSNRSLILNHDVNDEPNFKDTKAWILYRSGHRAEALLLLKEAATASPYDADIQAHLREVESVVKKGAQ
jgi:tetratricopeptide (TPR) repeat protein